MRERRLHHYCCRYPVYGFPLRLSVCLSVCLRDISKTAAARITKLVVEVFHHDSWKPIYFGVKRSKVKGWVFALL